MSCGCGSGHEKPKKSGHKVESKSPEGHSKQVSGHKEEKVTDQKTVPEKKVETGGKGSHPHGSDS